MRRTVAFLAAVIVASSAAAVEKIGPTWSEVTGIQYSKAPLNRAPAIINTQFASATTPDWRPVVDKVESIPGCKLPPATK